MLDPVLCYPKLRCFPKKGHHLSCCHLCWSRQYWFIPSGPLKQTGHLWRLSDSNIVIFCPLLFLLLNYQNSGHLSKSGQNTWIPDMYGIFRKYGNPSPFASQAAQQYAIENDHVDLKIEKTFNYLLAFYFGCRWALNPVSFGHGNQLYYSWETFHLSTRFCRRNCRTDMASYTRTRFAKTAQQN